MGCGAGPHLIPPVRFMSHPFPSPPRRLWARVLRMLTLLLLPLAAVAQPTITGLSPARNLRNAPRAANVALTFSQAISAGTAGSSCAPARAR